MLIPFKDFGDSTDRDLTKISKSQHDRGDNAKTAALEAVTDVLTSPDDDDYQTALKVQFKKIIDADPELADTIAQILAAEADGQSGTQIMQNVVVNRNQSIGQNYGNAIGNVKGDVKF
jgi:hypothetical protein